MLISVTGCQLPGGKSKSSGGVRGSKPYTIRGKTYYPLTSARGFTEEGIASWYGKDFHGKQTANGERYNMYSMTAAHKLLPFGTEVRVTNKTNGRSIVVRINDRGPFIDNRVIDLTKTGAEKIGMLGPGTARVHLVAINTQSEKPQDPVMKADGNLVGRFYIQVGAFGSQENADRLTKKIQTEGQNARAVKSTHSPTWLVHMGPYPSMFDATNIANRVRDAYPHAFVLSE